MSDDIPSNLLWLQQLPWDEEEHRIILFTKLYLVWTKLMDG